MVDNTTLGEFSIGGTILGSLTSAFGGYEAGQDEKKMYDYQAGVARLNAQIADQNAQYASDVGELQAGAYGYKAARRLGRSSQFRLRMDWTSALGPRHRSKHLRSLFQQQTWRLFVATPPRLLSIIAIKPLGI